MARTNKYASINFNHVYEKNLTNGGAANGNGNHPSSAPSLYSTIASPNSFNNPNNLYKNHLPSARSHGRMLVLTRPATKPVSAPASPSPIVSPPKQQPTPTPSEVASVQESLRADPSSDKISLRPLGRTGGGSLVSPPAILGTPSPIVGQEKEKEIGVGSPKPDKFVPPHLRPGFVAKQDKPGPEALLPGRETGHRQFQNQQQGHVGSPGRYGNDGRPNSGGGGYDRTRRAGSGDAEPGLLNRPRSGGSRPSSRGWYCFPSYLIQSLQLEFWVALVLCLPPLLLEVPNVWSLSHCCSVSEPNEDLLSFCLICICFSPNIKLSIFACQCLVVLLFRRLNFESFLSGMKDMIFISEMQGWAQRILGSIRSFHMSINLEGLVAMDSYLCVIITLDRLLHA
ncbi:unnamed protein product [Linum trigynum]|uniref:Uncharacterized protein n=1 Tax=Linum trigynum TaxID=586398 RepID=A0AAV2CJZ6_9ROSI